MKSQKKNIWGKFSLIFQKIILMTAKKNPALLRSFQKFKNHHAFMKTQNQDLPHMTFYTRLDN